MTEGRAKSFKVKGTPAPYGATGAFPNRMIGRTMSDETGPKRDHYGETSDAVRRTFTDPAWQTRRLLDEVRAAALANAVRLMTVLPVPRTEDVLATAKQFEAYLTGEEANDGT